MEATWEIIDALVCLDVVEFGYGPGFAAMATDDRLEAHMARFVGGEMAAFEVLYARLAPRVRAMLRALSGDPRLTEDLLQTTFLKMHRARATWIAGAPVEPWVFAIARRVFLDHLRHRRRRPEHLTHDGALPEPPAPDDAPAGFARLDEQSLRALEAGLAALNPTHREALVLLKIEGLSVAEAAAVVGVSPGNLKVRAHRAYEALRKALGVGGPS